MESPTTSYWLKGALADLAKRDPVDALSDVETLRWIQELRNSQVQHVFSGNRRYYPETEE